jgi:F-type H+-transporting ATPase subunit b
LTIRRLCDRFSVLCWLCNGYMPCDSPVGGCTEAAVEMISLDGSILAAILIFLSLLVSLNFLLFRPLLRVQAERERRTTGTATESRSNLARVGELFERYSASIKQARAEVYQRHEQLRADAMGRRAAVLDEARRSAESLVQEARASVRAQAGAAREQLEREAAEIAKLIASTVLQKPA